MRKPLSTGYWVTDGKNTGLVIKTHYNTFVETRLVISDDNDFMQEVIESLDIYDPEAVTILLSEFNNMVSKMGVSV